MKRKIAGKRIRSAARRRCPARRAKPRPRNVYQALQKLLNLANQMQARAAALENSLRVLRGEERCKIMKDLLSALRDSPAGNLIGAPPDWPGEIGLDATARGMLEALMEAFPIRPVGEIGDRLPVKHGEVSESVELDRPIGESAEECAAVEIVSVGWSCDGKVLLKPVARPVVERSCPAVGDRRVLSPGST